MFNMRQVIHVLVRKYMFDSTCMSLTRERGLTDQHKLYLTYPRFRQIVRSLELLFSATSVLLYDGYHK